MGFEGMESEGATKVTRLRLIQQRDTYISSQPTAEVHYTCHPFDFREVKKPVGTGGEPGRGGNGTGEPDPESAGEPGRMGNGGEGKPDPGLTVDEEKLIIILGAALVAAALLFIVALVRFFKREKTQKTNKVDHDCDDERRKKAVEARTQVDADKEGGQEPGPFVNGQEDGANAPQP